MSVSVILSQLEALVTKMELVGSRLCNKRIRPTADQLNDFQNLHTRFKATLANFDTGIQKLLASYIFLCLPENGRGDIGAGQGIGV
jgi:hypothetical protein